MKFSTTLIVVLCLLNFSFPKQSFSQEEAEYKKFKLEDAYCDVGVRYKSTPQGLTVGVSAIATGKGAEFRKWSIYSIKLRIGNEKIWPDKDGKFYVTEESFWRVPGAIVFAAIGAFGEYGGSNLNNNLSKVGVALGLGFIALQAKGQISGERCIFYIPSDIVKKIEEGKDSIEIVIKNEGQHLEDYIKIGIIRPTGDIAKKYNFKNMSEDEIFKRMDSLKEKIVSLEQEQGAYKYGKDPEYDAIQKKIENFETERGLAYKAWFEKKNGPDSLQ
jgi:hypothetical protein